MDTTGLNQGTRARTGWLLKASVLALACLRLCHVHVLWIDEDYHLAAAIDMLHGRAPYRDFWYDKPPLAGLFYLLIGGHAGWPLRFLDAAYVCVAAWFHYKLAADLWSAIEGKLAALLFAFCLAFYLPSAVLPFAADAMLLLPHIAAVYCAQKGRPVWAGVCAGIGFLGNLKALAVLATCVVWLLPQTLAIVAGFGAVLLLALAAAIGTGAWPGYREQVWQWGIAYANGSPVLHPVLTAITRTAGWLAFNLALVFGAVFTFRDRSAPRTKLTAWLFFSFAAVCLGTRFTPHYYLQLVPPMVILGSRGLVLAFRQYRSPAIAITAALLLIPVVRFLPHYVVIALNPHASWSDLQLDRDSQEVAAVLEAHRQPGNTLLVWGYRPDIYVYTRMVPAGIFWDSQPLTGVPADRHLRDATSFYSGPAAQHRRELLHQHPSFLVDGLSLMNPALKPDVYPELRPWLSHYKLIARTHLSLVYELTP